MSNIEDFRLRVNDFQNLSVHHGAYFEDLSHLADEIIEIAAQLTARSCRMLEVEPAAKPRIKLQVDKERLMVGIAVDQVNAFLHDSITVRRPLQLVCVGTRKQGLLPVVDHRLELALDRTVTRFSVQPGDAKSRQNPRAAYRVFH